MRQAVFDAASYGVFQARVRHKDKRLQGDIAGAKRKEAVQSQLERKEHWIKSIWIAGGESEKKASCRSEGCCPLSKNKPTEQLKALPKPGFQQENVVRRPQKEREYHEKDRMHCRAAPDRAPLHVLRVRRGGG